MMQMLRELSVVRCQLSVVSCRLWMSQRAFYFSNGPRTTDHEHVSILGLLRLVDHGRNRHGFARLELIRLALEGGFELLEVVAGGVGKFLHHRGSLPPGFRGGALVAEAVQHVAEMIQHDR